MEELRIAIICFGGIFTFAFGLAWILPLVMAGQKKSKATRTDATFALLDLVLMLLDCIPIFWLFRAIPEAPSAYKTAREAWQSQSSIRATFWLSMAAMAVTIVACTITF